MQAQDVCEDEVISLEALDGEVLEAKLETLED
jgi:hypothetical protein